MNNIQLGKFIIGQGQPVLIIAEIACEHGGNLESAKRLILAAKEAGADIAKFQLHVPSAEMVAGKIKFWAGSMDDILREVNFAKLEDHQILKNFCEEVGIQYLCTPFCIEASDILEKLNVDGYKIGSGELTNLPMLRHVAQKKKPMIVSTGMSTWEEITDAVNVLKEENVPYVLLHCLSEYPPNYNNFNLKLIPELEKKFGIPVGFSDHSTSIYPAVMAVALGAKIIEKHFTIRELHGPDDLVSLDPEQFKTLVSAIRDTEKSLGSEKKVSVDEQVVRDWAHHSVVASREIKVGEIFSLDNLAPKRPGSGIPAKFLDPLYADKLIGKKATRDLPANTILTWEDVA